VSIRLPREAGLQKFLLKGRIDTCSLFECPEDDSTVLILAFICADWYKESPGQVGSESRRAMKMGFERKGDDHI
jgi:hypothetical protein